jgi:hypothetical protein
MAQGFTQPVKKMNTSDLPGTKGQPVYKADNLTANSKLIA